MISKKKHSNSFTLLCGLLLAPICTFGSQPAQTTLPLKFNTGNPSPYGLPSTTISIQGKTIPLIFDTGDSKEGLALTPKAIQGLKVKFLKKKVCGHSIDNGVMCRRIFIIPKVHIGGFTLKNVRGGLIPQLWDSKDNKHFIATPASQNGVIGYDLLSKFNVLLDYKNKKAILVKKGTPLHAYHLDNWTQLPFKSDLLSKAVINNKPMTIGWDTGSIPSCIKTSFVINFDKVKCPSPFSKFKSCKRILTTSFKTPTGSSMPNTWFKVVNIPLQAPFDGLVGSNFYRNNLVYFDFNDHRIYMKNNLGGKK